MPPLQSLRARPQALDAMRSEPNAQIAPPPAPGVAQLTPPQAASLWSLGMVAVLCAQFLSAMADNALLFGALALLRRDHFPDWSQPLLQEFFIGPYILLAPFAGPF